MWENGQRERRREQTDDDTTDRTADKREHGTPRFFATLTGQGTGVKAEAGAGRRATDCQQIDLPVRYNVAGSKYQT